MTDTADPIISFRCLGVVGRSCSFVSDSTAAVLAHCRQENHLRSARPLIDETVDFDPTYPLVHLCCRAARDKAPSEWLRHVMDNHLIGYWPYECPMCGKIDAQLANAQAHMRTHAPTSLTAVEKRQWFTSAEKLILHYPDRHYVAPWTVTARGKRWKNLVDKKVVDVLPRVFQPRTATSPSSPKRRSISICPPLSPSNKRRRCDDSASPLPNESISSSPTPAPLVADLQTQPLTSSPPSSRVVSPVSSDFYLHNYTDEKHLSHSLSLRRIPRSDVSAIKNITCFHFLSLLIRLHSTSPSATASMNNSIRTCWSIFVLLTQRGSSAVASFYVSFIALRRCFATGLTRFAQLPVSVVYKTKLFITITVSNGSSKGGQPSPTFSASP